MNIDKIFSLFDGEEFNSLKEKAQAIDVSLDYKNHPLFWVGMFKKLVQNHQLFNDQLLKFFDNLNEGLSTVDVDRAGEFVVFNKYLSNDLISNGLWNKQIKNKVILNRIHRKKIPIAENGIALKTTNNKFEMIKFRITNMKVADSLLDKKYPKKVSS